MFVTQKLNVFMVFVFEAIINDFSIIRYFFLEEKILEEFLYCRIFQNQVILCNFQILMKINIQVLKYFFLFFKIEVNIVVFYLCVNQLNNFLTWVYFKNFYELKIS